MKLPFRVKSTALSKASAEIALGAIVFFSFLSIVPSLFEEEVKSGAKTPQQVKQEIENVKKDTVALSFPTAKDAEGNLDLILQWANENNVQIWSFSSVEVKEGVVAGQYKVQQHTIDMRGAPEDVIRFIHQLNSGPMDTTLVDNVDLRSEGELWFSRIQLKVYTKA